MAARILPKELKKARRLVRQLCDGGLGGRHVPSRSLPFRAYRTLTRSTTRRMTRETTERPMINGPGPAERAESPQLAQWCRSVRNQCTSESYVKDAAGTP
jgi:hypothetical protein